MDTSPVQRRKPDAKRPALGALGMYLCASFLFFGPPVLGHASSMYVGGGIDPPLTMWSLVWWPYALRHGLNPFFTDRVWAPHGASLAWLTGVPGASLLAAPLTHAVGPVAAYNVLCLLAPALAAWTAFILCRRVTRQFWPSVLAGYVFGFSPYELGHVQGHLNLMFTCFIPLAVYLVLLRLERALTPPAFVLCLGAVLFGQFLFSNEVFATLSVFGAVALGLAHGLLPADLKPELRSTGVHILYAYGVAAAALSPYLYAILTQGILRHPLADAEAYSSDLLNFVVPTPLTLIGGTTFEPIARAFSGNYTEAGAYVGLPLVLVIALFARSHGRRPHGKFLLGLLGIVALASLGPALHIAGHPTVPLPWRLAMALPVIKIALPIRFAVYTALIVAIIVALWLSAAPSQRSRWALVCLAAICLLPDLWRPAWAGPAGTPAFFSDRLYRRYLREGETVLIIPYGANGNGTLWQAETDMYFRMAEGVGTGSIPRDFFQWPINYTFYSGRLIPEYGGQLKAYLAAHAIRTIIVADGAPGPWAQLFTTLGGEPLRVGGVTLYPVPGRLSATGPLTPLEIEARSNVALAASLIATAHYYLSHGIPLSALTPLDAEQRDLLPRYWGGYVASQRNGDRRVEFSTRTGLWLGPWNAGTISVGLTAPGQTIGPLVARYGAVAQRVYFPYPRPLTAGPARGEGVLLLMFSHDGIRRAAAMPEAAMPP